MENGKEKEQFSLYQRGKKVYMFSIDSEHRPVEKVRVFESTKDTEDYVKFTPNTKGFLTWVI